MPYKIGGGCKLEAYDEDNGQYTEEDKIKMSEFDDRWLNHCITNSVITEGYEPHIPTKGIHDDKYAAKFIEHFKHHLHNPSIEPNKIIFLLEGKLRPNRRLWLIKIGFRLADECNTHSIANDNVIARLDKYIKKNTDFNSIYFLKYNKDGTLECNALTKFEDRYVTTCWKVNNDLELKFVTLIETDKVYYEKKNKNRW